MAFSSVAKELIPVLSRDNSSEQWVLWLPRRILLACTRTDPRLRKKEQNKEEGIQFFVNQSRLQLNSGIWDDVQVQRSGRLVMLLPFPWMFFFVLKCHDFVVVLFGWTTFSRLLGILRWLNVDVITENVFCFLFSWTKKSQRWRKE